MYHYKIGVRNPNGNYIHWMVSTKTEEMLNKILASKYLKGLDIVYDKVKAQAVISVK